MSIPGLDEYIAGGHYSADRIRLRCPALGCETEVNAKRWSEFGTGGLDPEECPTCGRAFTDEDEVSL